MNPSRPNPASAETVSCVAPPTILWQGNEAGHLQLIDQTQLPDALLTMECRDLPSVWEAIKMLRVRGRPQSGSRPPTGW